MVNLSCAVDAGNSEFSIQSHTFNSSFPSSLFPSQTKRGILYKSGPALCERVRFLVGDDAIVASPGNSQLIFHDLQGKINSAILLTLFSIATHVKDDVTVNIVLSLPDSQIYGESLRNVYKGEHHINLDGSNYKITFDKVLVIEEGLGSIFTALSENLVRDDQNILSIDGGAGTTIATMIKRGQVITESRIVKPSGVFSLWESIAKSPHPQGLRKRLGSQGSPILIGRSYESKVRNLSESVLYGATDIDLQPVYMDCFKSWFKSVIAPILRETTDYHVISDKILLTGGFCLLPGMVDLLRQYPNFGSKLIVPFNPRLANVQGNWLIAQKRYG